VKESRILVAFPSVALHVILANKFQELSTYAGALPLGHYYKPRRAVSFGSKKRCNGYVRYQFTVYRAYKIFCAGRVRKV
jgi:hypothetical protein